MRRRSNGNGVLTAASVVARMRACRIMQVWGAEWPNGGVAASSRGRLPDGVPMRSDLIDD